MPARRQIQMDICKHTVIGMYIYIYIRDIRTYSVISWILLLVYLASLFNCSYSFQALATILGGLDTLAAPSPVHKVIVNSFNLKVSKVRNSQWERFSVYEKKIGTNKIFL